jgi:transcription factor IIIB subunit 2
MNFQDTEKLNEALKTISHDNDGIETLSDVDDAEIDQLILTEEERKLKTLLWNNLNKEWIQEQQKKKREKKERKKLKSKMKKTIGKSLKSKLYH